MRVNDGREPRMHLERRSPSERQEKRGEGVPEKEFWKEGRPSKQDKDRKAVAMRGPLVTT